MLIGLTLMLALITQLTLDVDPTPVLARRVQKLWQTKNLWGIALETYDRCYRPQLEKVAAQ
jgi:hypothetical protein